MKESKNTIYISESISDIVDMSQFKESDIYDTALEPVSVFATIHYGDNKIYGKIKSLKHSNTGNTLKIKFLCTPEDASNFIFGDVPNKVSICDKQGSEIKEILNFDAISKSFFENKNNDYECEFIAQLFNI
ncbi:hypothetical protein CL634_06245 [bacterium]|nr:hypothetical protein [bacterium]